MNKSKFASPQRNGQIDTCKGLGIEEPFCPFIFTICDTLHAKGYLRQRFLSDDATGFVKHLTFNFCRRENDSNARFFAYRANRYLEFQAMSSDFTPTSSQLVEEAELVIKKK